MGFLFFPSLRHLSLSLSLLSCTYFKKSSNLTILECSQLFRSAPLTLECACEPPRDGPNMQILLLLLERAQGSARLRSAWVMGMLLVYGPHLSLGSRTCTFLDFLNILESSKHSRLFPTSFTSLVPLGAPHLPLSSRSFHLLCHSLVHPPHAAAVHSFIHQMLAELSLWAGSWWGRWGRSCSGSDWPCPW